MIIDVLLIQACGSWNEGTSKPDFFFCVQTINHWSWYHPWMNYPKLVGLFVFLDFTLCFYRSFHGTSYTSFLWNLLASIIFTRVLYFVSPSGGCSQWKISWYRVRFDVRTKITSVQNAALLFCLSNKCLRFLFCPFWFVLICFCSWFCHLVSLFNCKQL